jgi:hypothetical protein
LRKKAEDNKSKATASQSTGADTAPNLTNINDNLASLMEQMKNNPPMFGCDNAMNKPVTPIGSGERKPNKKKNKGKKM